MRCIYVNLLMTVKLRTRWSLMFFSIDFFFLPKRNQFYTLAATDKDKIFRKYLADVPNGNFTT
jgi:hypothetical protein